MSMSYQEDTITLEPRLAAGNPTVFLENFAVRRWPGCRLVGRRGCAPPDSRPARTCGPGRGRDAARCREVCGRRPAILSRPRRVRETCCSFVVTPPRRLSRHSTVTLLARL